jgi:hypothetical protein
MSDVLSYINDPNKTGVHCISFSISISSLLSLFKEISTYSDSPERFKLREEKELKHFHPRYLAETAMEDLANAADYLSIIGPEKGVLATPKILSPKTFQAISTKEMGISQLRGHARFAPWSGVFLTSNFALIKTEDAINTKAHYIEPHILLNVASIKENGCKVLEEFVKSIPIVGQDAKLSKISQKHSSRYCSEPIIAAIVLWMYTHARGIVPDDIQNYLQSSITYYEKEEWRISIILAAIAVESILAEIYEEHFHDLSPSDPLGALKDKIERKQRFPPEVLRDIEIVNQSRISAVHRSSTPVGSKEARNALVGATKIAHWAFSEGPLHI